MLKLLIVLCVFVVASLISLIILGGFVWYCDYKVKKDDIDYE
jgi:hypothetical protein